MGLYSYGGRAVIKGFINSIKENIPDAKLTLMSSHFEKEYPIYEEWDYKNVKLIDHIWYKESKSPMKTIFISGISASKIFLKFLLYKASGGFIPIKNEYKDYDVIVDLYTDGPNEHYGLIMAVFPLFNAALAILSGKPILISASSIGPFRKLETKGLAKLVLNNVDMILAREAITKNYLESFGINKPKIYLTADHAFLMKPSSKERIDEIFDIEGIDKNEKLIIGISPSRLIHKYAFPEIAEKEKKYDAYVDAMVKTVQYISEKYGGLALLIPHSSAASALAPNEDDHIISKEIYEHVKDKIKIKLLEGDYDADELKGVIGRSQIFIGFRMHPTIASTSMGVPTLAIVYGHKSHGIIGKMMGQEEYIIEIEKYNPTEFLSQIKNKVDDLFENRENVQKELISNAQIAEQKALLNGKYLKELMEQSAKQKKLKSN